MYDDIWKWEAHADPFDQQNWVLVTCPLLLQRFGKFTNVYWDELS